MKIATNFYVFDELCGSADRVVCIRGSSQTSRLSCALLMAVMSHVFQGRPQVFFSKQ